MKGKEIIFKIGRIKTLTIPKTNPAEKRFKKPSWNLISGISCEAVQMASPLAIMAMTTLMRNFKELSKDIITS